MKTPKKLIRIFTVFLLLGSISLSVYSQKLNTVQEASVWAPGNIKVDAKLNEWDDTFQAYNKTTEVFYTLSNDDKNLYLALKSTDPLNNSKIIAGGINLTINKTGKKKDKDAYVVIFPLVDMAAMRNRIISMGMGSNGVRGGDMDSTAVSNLRKQALSMVKDIKLIGFTDIPDSVISIYNEYGLKAAIDYDAKGNLTCEMAIPLKYLHLINADNSEFNYNIKLNGLDINALFPGAGAMFAGGAGGFGGGGGGRAGGGGGGFGGGGGAGGGMGGIPTSMLQMQTLISPTDFWGKYTLAKKQ